MDVVLITLSLLVFILGLALFSNRARTRQNQNILFELTPNCLLTRWPLLFVTGPRSLFYFSSYWNLYTSFLAEHGYEVYTLHLPWSHSEHRKERFLKFLEEQEKNQKRYHLFMDFSTLQELEDTIRNRKSSAIESLTEVLDDQSTQAPSPLKLSSLPVPTGTVTCPETPGEPFFLGLSYRLHRLMHRGRALPSLSTLGAFPKSSLQNSRLLLLRSQVLAEMDLREDH